jgi:glycosyltransferase involved in cell wall biosynthesis
MSAVARGGTSTPHLTTLDVAAPATPIVVPAGAESVRVLLRRGDLPIGWITIARPDGPIDDERLAREMIDRMGERLRVAALWRSLSPAAADRPVAPPPITVVVCTRDRTESLARCLRSLRDVSYGEVEVVVVDNAPATAATADLVASMAPDFDGPKVLRYVREDRPGLDWARNRGIAEASHDIVAFTDDDVRVDEAWLAGIARGFADPHVMMVTGLVAPAELETRAQLLFEDAYGGMGKGFRPTRWRRDALTTPATLLGAHHLGVGANMAFRRALLDRVGGFDTALDVGTPSHGAGDLEMFHRVLVSGALAHYEPSALVWHSHRRDDAGLARQLRDNGRAFGVYLIGCALRGTVPPRKVASYAARIWVGWLVGRLVRSLIGRDALPARLRAAELWGAMQSPWAYWRTHRSDRAIRRGASSS